MRIISKKKLREFWKEHPDAKKPLQEWYDITYDRIDAEIGHLLKKGYRNLSPEEHALLELMTKLIEDYDDQHYSFPKSQSHELLRALMEQNGLSQADLLPIFKSRGYISEVLSGKRAISKRIAKALGARFSVSAELFI